MRNRIFRRQKGPTYMHGQHGIEGFGRVAFNRGNGAEIARIGKQDVDTTKTVNGGRLLAAGHLDV